MRIKIQFGLNEPLREAKWYQPIEMFPTLVLYKGKKWEFFMYGEDPAKLVDLICTFSEVMTYDPNWYATTYVNIDDLFNIGYGANCQCGAIYSGIPWDHMLFCPKWIPWSKI